MSVRNPASPGRELAGRVWGDLQDLVSLLVFFSATAVLFRSIDFALIVTASLGFHELGHAALLARLRLKWRIAFGLVGAWTWSEAAERSRLSNLQNSAIHLAGPVFSLLLALIALAAAWVFPSDSARLLVMANFGAQVALLNLLPLGALTDGGKVVRRIMAPLGCTGRTWAALLPLISAAVMLLAYLIVELPEGNNPQVGAFWLSIVLMAAWMTGSLMLEAHRDGDAGQSSGRPVTPLQGFMLLALLWGLMALALVISAHTPFWLAPEYVMGSLENASLILRLLSGNIL